MDTEGILPRRNSTEEMYMGKTADRQQYIHNYARTLLAQIKGKIPLLTLTHYDSAIGIAAHIYSDPPSMAAIMQKLSVEKDETLGRLACAGVGESSATDSIDTFYAVRLHEVSNSYIFSSRVPKWFNIRNSGRDLVLNLAAQAVCAAIADNIHADMKKANVAPDYSKVGLPA